MNELIQNLGKRAFYTARKSATLRRLVAMPLVSGVANRVARKILRPMPRYPQWIADHVAARAGKYACSDEPGLLSFLTTVWNTPLPLLKAAVESLLSKQTVKAFQWVLLDNGSTDAEVVQYLKETVTTDPRVVFLRVEKNLGIIGGMHLVLSHATGRYVLPFDSDDLLDHDAVAILTHQIRVNHFPKILYTDEDKLDGNQRSWPYFKPDWDPVLFVNSCYIAHLGCFDRQLAGELGVYTDQGSNGCHDWDTFTRFMLAGHKPVHIPEIVYSWRMHSGSTASNTRSKNYIFDSQRNLLTHYLNASGLQDKFELQLSPLFQGSPDWWIKRKPGEAMPILPITFEDGSDVRAILPMLEGFSGLMFITHKSIRLESTQWQCEVAGLIERYPDTVMIGGRVLNSAGRVVESGRVPGFAGVFGCPDRGRDAADPGMGAELWKQRSVSGVSASLCVMKAEFLRQIMDEFKDHDISWNCLGAWAALSAWRHQQRIIYTPFFSGICDLDLDAKISSEELAAFAKQAADFIPDHRFYSPHFGMTIESAYTPRPLSEVAASATTGGG